MNDSPKPARRLSPISRADRSVKVPAGMPTMIFTGLLG
jgi:hypothetical protein